ncbi:hypothetical protein INH39_24665 [Massilia violaceinigra]|uniref:Uncharacterized protein n=1 Tax=Massilia violaceinigra TaxID=2045208 RepID=A0ABY4A7I7_9BURK|nr:hypothetical protein [Massilia violaceinigra]UOD28613.1 hypothetical protein INH39_24665 [Massilia violaceinigra]
MTHSDSNWRRTGNHVLEKWPQRGAASQREHLMLASTRVAGPAPVRLSSIAELQAMPAQTAEG